MPWTDITRSHYVRRHCRYASDLSDAKWRLIQPLLPLRRRLGRPRKADLREVMNAILFMASTGCQWRMLPKEFPPFTTVQNYSYDWRDNGILRLISNTLVAQSGEKDGREASPSAGVIDSQSVKTTESGGIRGFDAGKKINGRKRHIVTDTSGLLVGLVIHSAAIQDRDGAPQVLRTTEDDGHGFVMCLQTTAMPAKAEARDRGGGRGGRLHPSNRQTIRYRQGL